ncbi:MAG: hypothetical protein ACFCUS_10490 [Rubrimonas sp.]|uniref:hypothetical protein n=1 Tax=Rubrimonas sp. TaxID=2036015 RepID=UPI002FDD49E3
MRWLVALDEFEADGTISRDQAAAMKRRARADMAAFGINTVYVAGIVAVTLGAILWTSGPLGLTLAGLLIFGAGAAGVARFGERLRVPAHAAVVIGLALTIWGVGWFAAENFSSRMPQILIGGFATAAGLRARILLPDRFAFAAGMAAVAGLSLHLWGLLTAQPSLDLDWLAMLYAGVAVLALGLWLDVRALSALSIAFFASALSTTAYSGANYSVTIYESTLTIAQFALIAGLCLLTTRFEVERWSRHARIVGLLAFVWINVAFWIGSLWGDWVGAHLWGPNRADFFAEIQGQPYEEAAWEAAHAQAAAAWEAFSATALEIPAAAFSIMWALLLLGTALWAALTDRRSIFNAAATFGAIHFYTQWFETFEDEPSALIAAGVIAIALAWGARAANRRFAERHARAS